MSNDKLGRLEKVDLRKVWKEESGQFTPWLAQEENLRLLGETLGMQLELVQQEKAVGRFMADILCKDLSNDSWVVIENQLARTDHSHLGQILTYAAGLEAATMIWIAPEFTEEHRAALDWLNEHTDEKTSFLGLEVELWRIGNSPPAPKFSIVAKPNDWSRVVRADAERAGMTEYRRTQLEFWTKYREYMTSSKSRVPCQPPAARHWLNHNVGWPGMWLSSITSYWDSESGKAGPEIRVDLYMSGSSAKRHFAQLNEQREDIERELGLQLVWYNPEDKQACRIYTRRAADVMDRTTWPQQFEWLRKNVELFYKVFAPRVKKLGTEETT
ncbi:DUF4268 domain-containing protein [candidate division WOR-3 bacterium]|uniref:DUF4268 domain-containing protein n=1 Tax=candidate division WOR-3 bacterium TaxID=2052148 RepID=A0A938BTK2_UNCW3|nr:DUF4268 domain-containing protein [candidate division WOR-3 bacterium]